MKEALPNSMVKEAIILCGGLGTRLREAVSDLPKSLAPVAGVPFIQHLINELLAQGINKFIFAAGHKHELIQKYIATIFPALQVQFSIEQTALGTGGAIAFAARHATTQNVLVVNGDTFYKANIAAVYDFHYKNDATCTLALKQMQDFSRFGSVELNETGRVVVLKEKQFCESGLVNGGFYILNIGRFLQEQFPASFSFETGYLAELLKTQQLFGLLQDSYFIDIGIPEDLEAAHQHFLKSS